jgi:pimeloyl-ACP methyl ester carboxylesterase
MPVVNVNGINLSYSSYGAGEPVVLVTGSGARGSSWGPYQVPALTAAGYRVITVDNRGIAPSDMGPEGFTVHDMAADTAGLITELGIAPCRVVGFSLGAMIVQELLIARDDLVTQAVLMATRGRVGALHAAMAEAEGELLDKGIVLPRRYAAVVHAMQYLSPRTQGDEQRIRDWLDIFEMSLPDSSVSQAQRGLDMLDDRLAELTRVTCDCLAIGFVDDIIIPPRLCREVARQIPGCRYQEVPGCGHYGHLEEPEAVNSLILGFFAGGREA